MGDRGPEEHAQHKDGCVTISLAGQKKLAAGTTAGQAEGQTRQRHPQEIPEVHRVGDRLRFKTRFELPQDEIDSQRRENEGDESRQQVRLPEQDEVTDGAHGAESTPLGEKPDEETKDERDGQGRMQRSRTLHTVKEHPALGLAGYLGEDQHEQQQARHEERQHPARRGVGPLGASEIVPPFQEQRPDPDAEAKAQQTENGIAVAACQTERRPPGASQKNERPDHGENAEYKADDRRGAESGAELPEEGGRRQGTENKSHDLGTDILHQIGPVQAKGAGDVPLEAGDADPHIAGIAHFLKQRGHYADRDPDADNAPRSGEDVLKSFHVIPPVVIGGDDPGHTGTALRKNTSLEGMLREETDGSRLEQKQP